MTSVLPVSKYIPTKGYNGVRLIKGGSTAPLFVHALPDGGGASLYSAVAGEEVGFPSGRSSFNMNCLDVDTTVSCIGFSQWDGTNSYFCIPAATSFRYIVDIINWTNRSTLATHARAQVGVFATPNAVFTEDMNTIPQAASNSAIYVEFAQNRMKLVFNTTSSAWVDVPTTLTAFSLRIEYLAGKGAFLYLNNKKVAQVTLSTATTAMQVFARAGHSVLYTALTDAPIRFEIDAVSVAFNKV